MRRLAPVLIATACTTACYEGLETRDEFGDELGVTGDAGDGVDTGTTSVDTGTTGDGDTTTTGDGDTTTTTTGDTGTSDTGDTTTTTTTGDGDTTTTTTTTTGDGDTGDPNDAAMVCERWNADRADLSEGAWDGSVQGCNAGDMDPAWRDRTLTQVNLYRWLANLPPVTTSAERNNQAQACALIMQAAGQLSHSPPMNWECWTQDGATGAGNSNIAGTAAVQAIDLYMVDNGNASTMGHRRWILSNSLGPTGFGSTSGYSCMWTLYGQGNAGAEWTAWPPPGPFPEEAVNPLWFGGGIDEWGWTIQSDSIGLGSAEVTITLDGQDMPVTVNNLASGYGSSSAISMVPQGWTTTAGNTYHVEVTGIAQPFSYDVEVIAC